MSKVVISIWIFSTSLRTSVISFWFLQSPPPNPSQRKKEKLKQPDKNLFFSRNPEHRNKKKKRMNNKMFQGHDSLNSKKQEITNHSEVVERNQNAKKRVSSDQPFARGRLLPCLSLYYVTLGSLPPIPFNSENNSNSPCFMRSPSSQGTSNWSMSWIWINRLPLIIIIINSLHALSSLQIVQILYKIVCFYVYKIWLYETRIWYCVNNLLRWRWSATLKCYFYFLFIEGWTYGSIIFMGLMQTDLHQVSSHPANGDILIQCSHSFLQIRS